MFINEILRVVYVILFHIVLENIVLKKKTSFPLVDSATGATIGFKSKQRSR